uniref:Slc36a-3 n=1 Tax=Schmidtea mediterranea TaxID=79327 RepID=A0A0H3YJE0_SCHMD|nr:slc36a-3 [Schmidtea mediterranea]
MDQVTTLQKFIDFANIFKAFIGCTYLTIPFAFYQSGIGLGIIMLLIIGWLNDYCCVQIVKCKDIIVARLIEQFDNKYKSGNLLEPEAELVRCGHLKDKLEDRITLGHIAKYAFGKKGQWIVTICLLISQFGFCTGYFVFVGNTLMELIYNLNSNHSDTSLNSSSITYPIFNIKKDHFLIFMLLVPLPIFILFSLLRTVRNMGWISIIANSAIAFGYFSIVGLLINHFSKSEDFELFNFQSVAVIFGILTAGFEGIGTVIPIETSMIGNRHNFSRYLHVTLFLVVCVFGSFGILGHLRYGTNTKQIILQNLPYSTFVNIINLILIFSVVCTYPLQMFPVVEIVEFLFFRKRSAEFVEDRIQILSSNAVNEQKSDLETIDDELLNELSGKESDDDDEREVKRKSLRRFKKSVDKPAPNYGAVDNTNASVLFEGTDTNLNENMKSTLESVYTKKQLRMIRVLNTTDTSAPTWKRNIIRIILVLLQLSLALVMRNNFAYLSAIIGAVGSSFLCYILPAATHLKLTRETDGRLYCKILDVIIVIFGIIGSVASLVVTIVQMVRKDF